MVKANPVTARYDDSDIARRLPHVVDIGYNHTYEANVDGEGQDALKPEIVAWLADNVKLRDKWQFCCSTGVPELILDSETGEALESSSQQFRVRFAQENDAFNFKLKWYGAAP